MENRSSSEQTGSLLRRLSSRLKGKRRDPSTRLHSEADYVDSDHDSSPRNKNWAQSYINGPLTAIEPSQETGPGSSFINPHRSSSVKDKGKQVARNNYPTPPTSATSPKGASHRSNPFSNDQQPTSPRSPTQDELDQLKLLKILDLDNPAPSRSSTAKSHRKTQTPVLPELDLGLSAGISRSQSVKNSKPEAKVSRSNTGQTKRYPPITRRPVGLGVSRSQSANSEKPALQRSQSVDSADTGLRRTGSLSQRYPGDMSHRPLEQIKRETRAADRAPHLRKKNMPRTDIIDSLDDIGVGGTYHHDGPYDATLASRNKNKMYSPVEATKYSNMEALKATPYENVQDSLRKHVPLQGTAIIPPGITDMNGRRMSYEEGADLMREADAPGGAYRRFDDIVSDYPFRNRTHLSVPSVIQEESPSLRSGSPHEDQNKDKDGMDRLESRITADTNTATQPYHPDDLKGKGEPSFTIERKLKEHKRHTKDSIPRSGDGGPMYEMQPTRSSHSRRKGDVMVRQRSYSSSSRDAGASGPTLSSATTNDSHVRRSHSHTHTTGKRIGEGLKRRFGSLRRKEPSTQT